MSTQRLPDQPEKRSARESRLRRHARRPPDRLHQQLLAHLAFDPGLLERTWAEVKQVMAVPSLLDPLTKG
jgi:hypothetical protein